MLRPRGRNCGESLEGTNDDMREVVDDSKDDKISYNIDGLRVVVARYIYKIAVLRHLTVFGIGHLR